MAVGARRALNMADDVAGPLVVASVSGHNLRSSLPRRFAGPTLECMGECADFMVAEQPRDFGNRNIAVREVASCEVRSQALQHFGKGYSLCRQSPGECALTGAQATGNFPNLDFPMRQERDDRILDA